MNLHTEPGKTFVMQAFQQLGISDGLESSVTNINEMWVTKVVINIKGVTALNNLGKDLGKHPLIFKSQRMTKKPSEQEAFGEVMAFMLKHDINIDWINKIKRQSGQSEYYHRILEKSQQDYNKNIEIIEVQETYNSKPAPSVFQIIGIDQRGTKYIIYTKTIQTANKAEGIQQISIEYLSLKVYNL